MTFQVEQIGPCSLYCADCTDVLPTLEVGSIDAVVTDPPYGISLKNHAVGKGRRNRDWTIVGDDSTDLGEFVLHWADGKGLPTVAFASPALPWSGKWRSRLVWHKHGLGMGGDRNVCWKSDWELIQVRNNGVLQGSRESSVLVGYDIRPSEFEYHPCQKPVGLLEYLIRKIQVHVVFDPFMGSGTTGVACIRLNRKFIGIEKESKYFDIACTRIEKEWKLKQSQLDLEEPAKKIPDRTMFG